MRTMGMVGRAKVTTHVMCPAGCGRIVLELAADEGVYRSSVQADTTRTEEGTCDGCEQPYQIPVTRSTRTQ